MPFRHVTRTATLAALIVLAPCFVAGQRVLDITHFGDTVVVPRVMSDAAKSGAAAEYFVDEFQPVSGVTVGTFPGTVRLYPVVRAVGELNWQVQPAARQVRPNWATWTADVAIGTQADAGRKFEFQMVLSRGPLAPGPTPTGILRQNTIAASPVMRVVRRIESPTVWIRSINGVAVQRVDREVLDVEHQAPIDIGARNIPPRAHVAVAVGPSIPSGAWWVMAQTIPSSASLRGSIIGTFGIRGLHNYQQFRVIAFVTMTMPPVSVPIPAEEWSRYERTFLAETSPITVLRWEGETRITHINGTMAHPNTVMAVDGQSHVRGTLKRRLRQGERLWLICVPTAGTPWVAGWTKSWEGGGQWSVPVAQLNRGGERLAVDLIAVISADVLNAPEIRDLRTWLYDARERSINTVRIRISRARAASNSAHTRQRAGL